MSGYTGVPCSSYATGNVRLWEGRPTPDPRVEAMLRKMTDGEPGQMLIGRSREWWGQVFRVALAAADAVDPLRQALDAVLASQDEQAGEDGGMEARFFDGLGWASGGVFAGGGD